MIGMNPHPHGKNGATPLAFSSRGTIYYPPQQVFLHLTVCNTTRSAESMSPRSEDI
jgi:hypothetical protein